MQLKYVCLVILSAFVLLFSGCQGHISESGVLSPGQISASLLDQVVKVRGETTLAVENPGGFGGMYLRLGDNTGEVVVRIQKDVWDGLNKNEKIQFKQGKTVTAEGVLFQAGRELVVIYGKFSPPTPIQ